MNDLVGFLLARIAEDEAVANAAAGEHDREWIAESWEVNEAHAALGEGNVAVVGTYSTTADHIARWDPARVLAECAAKRRIVDFYRSVPEGMQEPYRAGLGRALRCLALPYAEHLDFREEWRP